ncbi:hypothetical protein EYF80_036252 [Liparis tanakae]|uniref:Uncharacterized protein n=1 Tax=Liparis tanakae TaxID=230148 RepID=A0A4Z2GLN4_9TELE|nr:hypothetical protein EYF80_036252 [Liparis tanakae]
METNKGFLAGLKPSAPRQKKHSEILHFAASDAFHFGLSPLPGQCPPANVELISQENGDKGVMDSSINLSLGISRPTLANRGGDAALTLLR